MVKKEYLELMEKQLMDARYENDCDYPWDESNTIELRGIDSIMHSMDVDGFYPSRRKQKILTILPDRVEY